MQQEREFLTTRLGLDSPELLARDAEAAERTRLAKEAELRRREREGISVADELDAYRGCGSTAPRSDAPDSAG